MPGILVLRIGAPQNDRLLCQTIGLNGGTDSSAAPGEFFADENAVEAAQLQATSAFGNVGIEQTDFVGLFDHFPRVFGCFIMLAEAGRTTSRAKISGQFLKES